MDKKEIKRETPLLPRPSLSQPLGLVFATCPRGPWRPRDLAWLAPPRPTLAPRPSTPPVAGSPTPPPPPAYYPRGHTKREIGLHLFLNDFGG
jgi:hypothetical protein